MRTLTAALVATCLTLTLAPLGLADEPAPPPKPGQQEDDARRKAAEEARKADEAHKAKEAAEQAAADAAAAQAELEAVRRRMQADQVRRGQRGVQTPEKIVTAAPRHRKPWAWSAEQPELLYKDRSWTHIGDGNFAATSDGADDLTRESVGTTLRVVVPLSAAAQQEIGKAQWKTVLLKGSVIGNDAGRMGDTKATIVRLGKTEIGKITRSGTIAIRFDKTLLQRATDAGARKDGTAQIELFIASGRNGATDVDDQELGRFKLILSTDPLPKLKPEAEPAPPTGKPGK